MFDATLDGLRKWIAGLFVAAIKNTSRPEERQAGIQWLLASRDILASDRPMVEKLKVLNAQLNTRAAIGGVATAVADAARHYKTAKIPLAMKIAMPATVLALPFVGLHGAGLAAFGSAIGLPVLLLVFLGTAGITSVIETVALHPNSRTGISLVVASILQAEAAHGAKADLRRRMAEEAAAPQATLCPTTRSRCAARFSPWTRSISKSSHGVLRQEFTKNDRVFLDNVVVQRSPK